MHDPRAPEQQRGLGPVVLAERAVQPRETTDLAPDHDERLVGEETVCIPRLAEATEEARDQREAPARDRALHLGVVPVRVPGLYVAIDRELAASDQIVLDRPERALEGELEV